MSWLSTASRMPSSVELVDVLAPRDHERHLARPLEGQAGDAGKHLAGGNGKVGDRAQFSRRSRPRQACPAFERGRAYACPLRVLLMIDIRHERSAARSPSVRIVRALSHHEAPQPSFDCRRKGVEGELLTVRLRFSNLQVRSFPSSARRSSSHAILKWCPRRESNSHVLRQRFLRPPRLPFRHSGAT